MKNTLEGNNSSHAIIYKMYFPSKNKNKKVFPKRDKKKLQSTIFLSYKLYKNLSPSTLQF